MIIKTLVLAIIPNGINLIKRYSADKLKVMGLTLNVQDDNNREFIDNRLNYKWKQVYHGMGDTWLDLYEVTDPTVTESEFIK